MSAVNCFDAKKPVLAALTATEKSLCLMIWLDYYLFKLIAERAVLGELD